MIGKFQKNLALLALTLFKHDYMSYSLHDS